MVNERKEHLKQYILACIRDSQLTLNDLTSTGVFEKLMKVISRDGKAVFAELRETGGRGLTRIAEPLAAGFLRTGFTRLEDFLTGKRK
jgi:hypothetical protein